MKKLFQWSDQFYDTVKAIALNIVPACEVAWGIVATAWDIPYGLQIGTTIGAVGVFLAMCIGMSNAEYQKAKQEKEAETLERPQGSE